MTVPPPGPAGLVALIVAAAVLALAAFGHGYDQGYQAAERNARRGGPDDQGRDDWRSSR